MSKLHFTTKHANAASVQRKWFVVDGTNQTVGRICSKIAHVLRGKNKAYYSPHVDCGDYVNEMIGTRFKVVSGYPGGQKIAIAKDVMKRRPEVIVEHAVKGMLPKNRLGRQMYKKLFVYVGGEHPHSAQQPVPFKF